MKLWPLTEFAGPGTVGETRSRKVVTMAEKARAVEKDQDVSS